MTNALHAASSFAYYAALPPQIILLGRSGSLFLEEVFCSPECFTIVQATIAGVHEHPFLVVGWVLSNGFDNNKNELTAISLLICFRVKKGKHHAFFNLCNERLDPLVRLTLCSH